MNTMPISETVSLRSVGLDEAWLQARVWENPACLGLGELEGVTRERVVSSGGRLDILLKNPIDDSMYEVETMLGDTDPDHIVRTIEYWDLIKRKWPQRQHYAVLIAERITRRFFNVVQILSNAVPLIAIQVSVVSSPHGQSLHFTKVLDVYEEPDDDTSVDPGSYDERYWLERSEGALSAARQLFELTQSVYTNPEMRFNKYSIVIASGGYNQLSVRKRSGNNVMVSFSYGSQREALLELLETCGLPYSEQSRRYRLQLAPGTLAERSELFLEIARLNKDWWLG